ncbi:serine protease [Nocardiopsis ansamitocini]|uniref:Serine protease n=1 Tax=Nocardiopsis ansamitocini TaxID=1670832 RepID=A0A9W6P4A5_9ACTN|nr:serine protease [Nocardiopsis ansamitocini]
MARAFGGTVLALGLAASAAPVAWADATAADTPDPLVSSPGQFEALKRDLGLSSADATDLMAKEGKARTLEAELRDTLGSDFGGAVFDVADGTLTVSVTDEAAVPTVEEAGARAEVVTYGEQALDNVVSDLNTAGSDAEDGVTGWYVDAADDSVVITVLEGQEKAAEELVAEAGVEAEAVTVRESAEQPTTLADVVGGNPYYFSQGGQAYVCSVGFGVVGGYVTAGHCGETGSTTYLNSGLSQTLGTVESSTFPGSDKAWVSTGSEHTPTGTVNGYDNADITVTGSDEAGIGASVCRSGQTTGWHCGTIESKNSTVNYPEGSVSGLTRTTACAEGGDSGGSWVAGTEAQGVTSGGSGNCTTGGTTYFQPVNEILSDNNLTLITG